MSGREQCNFSLQRNNLQIRLEIDKQYQKLSENRCIELTAVFSSSSSQQRDLIQVLLSQNPIPTASVQSHNIKEGYRHSPSPRCLANRSFLSHFFASKYQGNKGAASRKTRGRAEDWQ